MQSGTRTPVRQGAGCEHHLSRARRLHAAPRVLETDERSKAASVEICAPERKQPTWTGNSIPSAIVNFAIKTPLLYKPIIFFAKQAIVSSAEERGIRWQQHVREMQSTKEVYELKEQLEDEGLQYPDYYLQPFHAYEEGNLNWLAAFEVEPATYSMAIRTFSDDTSLSPEAALAKLRNGIKDAMQAYQAAHQLPAPGVVVDMGCSTGVSTRLLAEWYPTADITGLDLSPYFLAVAEWQRRETANSAASKRISYVHRSVEDSGLAPHSVDLATFVFIIHECPQKTIEDFIAESKRVLKHGGMVTFVDNNPKSKTIQNLPPFIFTLMKSTEPWSDEYYSYDLEEGLRAAGFRDVVTVEADHRHRAVMAIAP